MAIRCRGLAALLAGATLQIFPFAYLEKSEYVFASACLLLILGWTLHKKQFPCRVVVNYLTWMMIFFSILSCGAGGLFFFLGTLEVKLMLLMQLPLYFWAILRVPETKYFLMFPIRQRKQPKSQHTRL